MKELVDGVLVNARSYYYLLDFNESDQRETINKHFSKNRLCDLTISEYKLLWAYAIQKDFENNFKS